MFRTGAALLLMKMIGDKNVPVKRFLCGGANADSIGRTNDVRSAGTYTIFNVKASKNMYYRICKNLRNSVLHISHVNESANDRSN